MLPFYGEQRGGGGGGESTSAPGGGSIAPHHVCLVGNVCNVFDVSVVVGEKNVHHTPSRAPQSRQTPSSPPPPAARVCRRAPGQSGKSWTCGGWRAAASQSEPWTGRPRWRDERERQQLRVREKTSCRVKRKRGKPFLFSFNLL